MKAHIKPGAFSLSLSAYYSWIVIALLVTLSLGSQFAIDHPNWEEFRRTGNKQTLIVYYSLERLTPCRG